MINLLSSAGCSMAAEDDIDALSYSDWNAALNNSNNLLTGKAYP